MDNDSVICFVTLFLRDVCLLNKLINKYLIKEIRVSVRINTLKAEQWQSFDTQREEFVAYAQQKV